MKIYTPRPRGHEKCRVVRKDGKVIVIHHHEEQL